MVEWRNVDGFSDYLVSENGEVKNKTTGQILKQTITQKGYAVVGLVNGGKHKNVRVHRIVAMAFVANPRNKPQVNHKDGNKLNNKRENLEWVTGKENIRHSYWELGHGRSKNAPNGTITHERTGKGWNLVRKNLYMFRVSKNLTQSEFSEIMGVSRTMYSNIESGRRNGEYAFWLAMQSAFSIPDSDMWALLKLERKE